MQRETLSLITWDGCFPSLSTEMMLRICVSVQARNSDICRSYVKINLVVWRLDIAREFRIDVIDGGEGSLISEREGAIGAGSAQLWSLRWIMVRLTRGITWAEWFKWKYSRVVGVGTIKERVNEFQTPHGSQSDPSTSRLSSIFILSSTSRLSSLIHIHVSFYCKCKFPSFPPADCRRWFFGGSRSRWKRLDFFLSLLDLTSAWHTVCSVSGVSHSGSRWTCLYCIHAHNHYCWSIWRIRQSSSGLVGRTWQRPGSVAWEIAHFRRRRTWERDQW